MRKMIPLIFCVFLTGCATVASMQQVPSDGGMVEIYNAPVDEVYDVVLNAFNDLEMTIESEDKAQKVIVASTGASLTDGGGFSILSWSYGTKIGAYLKTLPDGQTELRVKTKDIYPLATTSADRSYDVHMIIYVKLIKLREDSGQFDQGAPFENGQKEVSQAVTPEEVRTRNLVREKYNLRAMGLTRRATVRMLATNVIGEQSRFSYAEDSEIDWFVDIKSPGKVFNPINAKKSAAHPGLFIEWTAPDGEIVKSEKINNDRDIMLSRLELKTVPEAKALGVWSVKVLLNDELFDQRQFEIARSY